MEIAGYEIPDQYVIGGVGVLVVGGFLLSRRDKSTEETATIRPAEGLTWQDIIGTSDEGKLIGPGGPSGTPGESGPPGVPGGPGTNPDPECSANSDCANGRKCRNGRCVKDRDRDRDRDRNRHRDRNGNRNHNRPDMPSGRDGHRDFTDPRGDTPRDRNRRDQSRNRINDRNRDRPSIRERFERRSNDRVRVNPRTGSIRHPDRDSRRNDRNRDGRAHADASGGTVKLGNIDKGTQLHINVSGGREIARARGRGRGGEGVAGINTDGYGRLDGRDGKADGFVRTNISPGSTTGSFMPGPQALSGRNDSMVIRKGETLKGLARRAYGSDRFWPRVVTLNNDVLLPEGEIPAGTRIRI